VYSRVQSSLRDAWVWAQHASQRQARPLLRSAEARAHPPRESASDSLARTSLAAAAAAAITTPVAAASTVLRGELAG
jgi:hypothetical protein